MALIEAFMERNRDWNKILREAYTTSRSLNVPAIDLEDGYVLCATAYVTALRFRKLQAIDAGAGVGFSTTWITKALFESSVEGKIYAIEKERERFIKLKELVAKYQFDDLVKPLNRNVLDCVREVDELNFVFVDIEKEHYLDFFQLIKYKILVGGVVLAHNVNHGYGSVNAFLNEASANGWKTIIVPTEEGVSISFKTA